MFQASAPKQTRGCSWIWLAVGMIGLFGPVGQLFAQTPADPKAAEAPIPAKPDDGDEPGSNAEVFTDANAKKALLKIEPLTASGVAIKSGDISTVQAMAVGSSATDPVFLRRYVDFFAAELTKRDNINAMINPPTGNQAVVSRGMEKAVDALLDPMLRARANDRKDFMTAYSKVLFESSLIKVLDNNLFSRIDAMIVLGTAGSPAASALDLYSAQLKKEDQVVWVKMWAARGLTNATKKGKENLEANKTILASEALVGFLESDPKLPWPVQIRALEALGSLRISLSTIRSRVDAASTAMKFAADPDARPEVRAWAVWALGMMKVPASVTPYNYDLLGHVIGDVAAEYGRLIVQEYDLNAATFEKDIDRARYLTGLLVFQVYPSLPGEEGITDSGILRAVHPSLNPVTKSFLNKLDAKVKDVSREAFELIRAGGTAQKTRRDELDSKVADLKGFLSNSSPKDRRLDPGGPEFPVKDAQVAGASGR